MLVTPSPPNLPSPGQGLANANAVIIVFVMPGCGACELYKPTFIAAAERYKARVPAYVMDVTTPAGAQVADAYGVVATPTTMVLRRGNGAIRADGAQSPQSIDQLFQVAVAVQ